MTKSKKIIGGMLLFGTLFLSSAYFFPAIIYDNAKSRYILLSAIVDYRQLNINPLADYTIDKAKYNGNVYSNKAIGASLVAAPVYALARSLFSETHDYPLNWPSCYVVTVATTSLSSALCGVLLWLLAMAWGRSPTTSLLMVLGFWFGSIFWVHATIFSGHAMAGSFLFAGFFILWKCKHFDPPVLRNRGSKATEWGWPFAAGLLVGLAGLCDYTAIFMGAIIAVYVLLMKIRISAKIAFFSASLMMAAVLFFYNWKCFGSPFSTGYNYNVYEEFALGSKRGLMGIGFPDPTASLKLLVSPSRGLFFIMPVFFFSLYGYRIFFKEKTLRLEFWIITGLLLCNFFIAAGFYGWHGGWTLGPRYLTVMLPFLALPMAFAPLKNAFFYILLGLSAMQVFPGVAFFPYAPHQISNPHMEIVLPLIEAGYTAFNIGIVSGMSETVSIICWLIGMTLLITTLAVFVAKASDAPRLLSIHSHHQKISMIGKLACLAVVACILLGLHMVKSEPPIVTGYQNHLFERYQLSSWRQAVLRDLGK